MLLKTAFREIKTSLGRYLAILAIIALGVGFFAGLRVTRTAMISTANHYLKDLAMFDDRILSTLGWTEEDVDAFRKLDGVSAAEGARSADVLCVGEDGSDMVLKAHSLTQQVNRLSLQAGRLPEKADECVVDAWRYDESALGSVIRLSDNNSADTMDTFASREYTVVGVAASPMYINYERGGTALGNGTVAAFVYLLPEGFALDYYTEIDVTLTGADGRIYTAAYDDAVEAMEQPLKELAAQRAQLRYDTLRSEAQEKLADAQQQLDDARKQLETGWAEYYDGLAKYQDGQASYVEGAGQYRDGLAEYDSGRAAYEAARKDYENGVSQYDQGQTGYEEGQRQYQAAQQQYQAALAQYQLLEQQAAALPEDSPELPVLQAKLAAMKEQLDATAAQLSQNQAQLEATAAQLAQSKAQLDAAGAALDTTEQQLAQAQEKLEESARRLAAAKAQLEETGPKLESARQELEDGERELSDHEGELDDARQKLEDLKEPDTYVLGRDTNVGYVCFESDTNIVAGVSRVFPLFFFLLAALVCITTMTRMVEEQRTQLGVLMAMGYGRGAILFKYFFYSGSASLLGCAIGFVGGSYIFPKILWHAYNIMYGFGIPIEFVLDGKLAAISVATYLLCALGATYLVCRGFLREVPAELIRPKAPKEGKRVLLERITFLWKRLGFLTKVSLRNVLRYKQRFFMMVLGIGGCTALLLAGFGIKDSITNVVDYQFEEITLYDAAVSFTEEMDAETQQAFSRQAADVSAVVFLHDGSVTVEAGGGAKTVNLLVPQSSLEGMMDLHRGGEKLSMPGTGETLLNDALAEALGVSVGDTVTLRDSDMNTLTVTVSGIFDNYVANYAIVSPETSREQWGSVPPVKTAFIRVADNSDAGIHAASARILDLENVSAVSVNLDTRQRVGTMMSVLDYIVWMVTVCAGALAFIVLYNLTNININERIREIATIKVLGFYPGETAAYVFRENNTLTFLGMLVGLPLGKWLHAYVMSQIRIDTIAFDVRIAWQSVVFSMLLTAVFAAIVDVVMYFKLRRISMAESLKSIK